MANIIAITNEHSYWDALDKKEIGDGYYTPEEINKVMAGFVENPQETSSQSRSCHCVAHENIETFSTQYQEDFCDLIRTPQTMTK